MRSKRNETRFRVSGQQCFSYFWSRETGGGPVAGFKASALIRIGLAMRTYFIVSRYGGTRRPVLSTLSGRPLEAARAEREGSFPYFFSKSLK